MPKHPHTRTISPGGDTNINRFASWRTVRRMFSLLYYLCILAYLCPIVKDFLKHFCAIFVQIPRSRPPHSPTPMAPSDEGAGKLPILGNLTGGENFLCLFLSFRQKSEIFATSLIRGRLSAVAGLDMANVFWSPGTAGGFLCTKKCRCGRRSGTDFEITGTASQPQKPRQDHRRWSW